MWCWVSFVNSTYGEGRSPNSQLRLCRLTAVWLLKQRPFTDILPELQVAIAGFAELGRLATLEFAERPG